MHKTSLKEPTAKVSLSCTNLSCGYSDRLVLENINFTLCAGDIIALLGTNGSGKSTLLKTMSKTLKPISGSVYLAEQDIQKLSPNELARKIAYVPQEEFCSFDFTAFEVVLMGRTVYAEGLFETQKDHEKAKTAMQATDCLHLIDQKISTLSGGEYQRVLLARALAQEASVLLLDEPTSHLDISHQMSFASLVKDLALEGYSILISVHHLNWASLVADLALLVGCGKVCYFGSMQDMLSSSLLEEIYHVPFHRLKSPDGALQVFPYLSR